MQYSYLSAHFQHLSIYCLYNKDLNQSFLKWLSIGHWEIWWGLCRNRTLELTPNAQESRNRFFLQSIPSTSRRVKVILLTWWIYIATAILANVHWQSLVQVWIWIAILYALNKKWQFHCLWKDERDHQGENLILFLDSERSMENQSQLSLCMFSEAKHYKVDPDISFSTE